MKVIHAADLHLDSPLRGLSDYEGAPVREVRLATRRALIQLIDLCLQEDAALLLLAGDLYDGDFKDYSTALFLVDQVTRLRETGCQVVWVRGNHDAQSQITRHLRLPAHAFELATAEPQTCIFEKLGIAVHGQGYASREMKDNLAQRYPASHGGLFNIGLLHTALDGRPGHDPYAPTTAGQLEALGYAYWALGHVHQREVVPASMPIVFPGNLQGRHVKERGAKGATVLNIDDDRLTGISAVALDVVRWDQVVVPLQGASSFTDVLEFAAREIHRAQISAEGRILACRVRLVGPSRAHGELLLRHEELTAELRRLSIETGFYLERVEHATRGTLLVEHLESRGDALAGLFQRTNELTLDEEALSDLKKSVMEPLGGLSTELLRDELDDFKQIVVEASQLLEGRLLGLEAPD